MFLPVSNVACTCSYLGFFFITLSSGLNLKISFIENDCYLYYKEQIKPTLSFFGLAVLNDDIFYLVHQNIKWIQILFMLSQC